MRYWMIGIIWIGLLGACTEKKVRLDEKTFTALLIDMHTTDGIVGVSRNFSPDREKVNYTYYNAVFEKYGIDKAGFDSCMYFYSSQPVLFAKIYDVVIDSLNQRLTAQERVLQELRADDSVNYYTGPDTLLFDTSLYVQEFVIDSIRPGNYNFNVTVRFDTIDEGKNTRITSWFISEDDSDTLHPTVFRIPGDTLNRKYHWTQHVDSNYNRLVIRFMDSDNLSRLKYRKGKVWNITLFKPYTPVRKPAHFRDDLFLPKEDSARFKTRLKNAPASRLKVGTTR